MSHRYLCSYGAVRFGSKSCQSVHGGELDKIIESAVLTALETPPREVLGKALEEAHRTDEAKKAQIEAERERLEYQVKLAAERFENADPKYRRVYHDLQGELEKRKKALEDYEQRRLINPFCPMVVGSEEELKELCDLAAEVPKIWHHPLVTAHERKEIIGCLIEKVSVITTRETVEGTLHWKSGGESPFYFYRKAGKYNLIKELHAQGCNTKEILQRLETGRTSTGQSMKLHVESFYKIYKRLGLKPHSKPSWFKPLQEEAVQLRDEGKTCRQISDLFNRRGLKSLSGQPWSRKLVFNLVSSAPRKPDPLKDIHREAFRDAQSRGLNFAQIAREFNERGIPRHNKRQWHKEATRRTWLALRKSGGESAKE